MKMRDISDQRACLVFRSHYQRLKIAENARWLEAPLFIASGVIEIGRVVFLRALIRREAGSIVAGTLPKGVRGWVGNVLRIVLFGYQAYKRFPKG
jgi:hypothetical protein